MAVVISRNGKFVTASTVTGGVLRAHECRTIQDAAALALNLTNDQTFAEWWASDDVRVSVNRAPGWLDRA